MYKISECFACSYQRSHKTMWSLVAMKKFQKCPIFFFAPPRKLLVESNVVLVDRGEWRPWAPGEADVRRARLTESRSAPAVARTWPPTHSGARPGPKSRPLRSVCPGPRVIRVCVCTYVTACSETCRPWSPPSWGSLAPGTSTIHIIIWKLIYWN